MKLSVDELKANHIVHVILDGTPHYSVVRKVTDTSVYLADPSLGNIVMSREEFSAIYSGYALVISDPQEVNQTENTTSTVQPENLTVGEMQSIQGKVIKGILALIAVKTAAVIKTIAPIVARAAIRILKRALTRGERAAAMISASVTVFQYLITTPPHRWCWSTAVAMGFSSAIGSIAGIRVAKR